MADFQCQRLVNMKHNALISTLLFLFSIAACTGVKVQPTQTIQTEIPTFIPSPTATNDPLTKIRFYKGGIPTPLADTIELPAGSLVVDQKSDANLWLEPSLDGKIPWVYVLVAPFFTVTDDVSMSDIRAVWVGNSSSTIIRQPLLLTEETLHYFEVIFGAASTTDIRVLSEDTLQQEAWKTGSFALIPFEQLNPKWKVLGVAGQSVIHKDLDLAKYPLTVWFGLVGEPTFLASIKNMPFNRIIKSYMANWDPTQMTTLLLTGTTTLSRMVGLRMEQNGVDWPGEKIKEWLIEPDYTHISNEASFYEQCPEYDPWYITVSFCSKPVNIGLFDDLQVDIIELTGNHLLDFNSQPLLYTLALYRQHNILTFGGGANAEQARQPLLLEKNGNRIALIGCNNPETALNGLQQPVLEQRNVI